MGKLCSTAMQVVIWIGEQDAAMDMLAEGLASSEAAMYAAYGASTPLSGLSRQLNLV
jgi:hypothetical protein